MAVDNENEEITKNPGFSKNEGLEKEREYKEGESNGKASDDPSAHRNMGANGYTQRSDQKDQLENLHIGGDDLTPHGANDHSGPGEQSQGPGFESEGSYEKDMDIRTREQKFGEKEPSGPPKTPRD
ncbi:hypothetical protein [Hymenobacter cellulosilyticus]|uniref:Uncharacterized protein n=1 Tax=Hymenobacter cellulosilyticus TaxID=2932248 RepID=A0A8T9Q445_9BACT|nr:hypothetical protein [Hymenobacter cellulosilyticus]UOQ70570.1 hypothetical protein MUN79_17870 [Hymenobacter cellulosilyticus]